MKIRDLPRAATAEEIAKSLACLSPKILDHVVREKSLAMDVVTLRTMTRGGMLDLEDVQPSTETSSASPPLAGRFFPSNRDDPPTDPRKDHFLSWGARLAAFCSFAANVSLVEKPTVLPELGSMTYTVPVLKVTDGFKEWFQEASRTLAQAWTQATQAEQDLEIQSFALPGMAQWAACAAMLDLPDVLQVLHAACPESISVTFPPGHLLGFRGCSLATNREFMKLDVSAAWCVWQFSSQQCLTDPSTSWLFANARMVLGKNANGAPDDHNDKDLTLLTGLVREDVPWQCDNTTFARAIDVVMRTQSLQDALCVSALTLVKRYALSPRVGHRIEAFRDAGVYAKHPELAAHAACESGIPSLIETLKDHLRPDRCDVKVLYGALKDHRVGRDLRAEAVLQLVLAVHQKSGVQAARDLFWGAENPASQGSTPIVHVFDKCLDRMLVSLMNAGIVEPHVAYHGRSTPMDVALGMNSPSAHVMTSWLARRSAHALLDDMDSASSSVVP